MADVKWIKIATGIFDDEKIQLIESMPSAYALIVCWFKLLCLAGKQNNSGVFVMGNQLPYTEKMLATLFRMKESTVHLALTTFQQFGMVERVDGVITIPNWGKHQNLEQMESKKGYMRTYMQEYRARQKQIADQSSEDEDACKTNCKTNSKANVSPLDIDKEKEGDIDKEKDKEKEGIYTAVVNHLNEKAGTSYRPTTPKTQALIRARIAEGFALEDFMAVIDKQCAEWMHDPKMEKFLRPETLFGTKFESYLNSKTQNRRDEHNAASGGNDTGSAAERVGTWL